MAAAPETFRADGVGQARAGLTAAGFAHALGAASGRKARLSDPCSCFARPTRAAVESTRGVATTRPELAVLGDRPTHAVETASLLTGFSETRGLPATSRVVGRPPAQRRYARQWRLALGGALAAFAGCNVSVEHPCANLGKNAEADVRVAKVFDALPAEVFVKRVLLAASAPDIAPRHAVTHATVDGEAGPEAAVSRGFTPSAIERARVSGARSVGGTFGIGLATPGERDAADDCGNPESNAGEE